MLNNFIGYLAAALIMFGYIAMPPTKQWRADRDDAFAQVLEKHGGNFKARCWLWMLIILASVLWPLALILAIGNSLVQFEWYD